MVGHGDALTDLERLLRRAGEGHCGLALVGGPAGTGKTSLVEQLLARHDGPTTRAVAANWERHRAYGVLSQLFPGLDVGADPVEAAEWTMRQLTGTTVAVIDDAHWADLPSLQAIASAIRHHPDARLLVVATAITNDPHAHAVALDLLPRIATAEIRLPALTASQVAELAAMHGVTLAPPVAERLRQHTEGIARHVVQLLAEAPAGTWARFDPELPAPTAVAAHVRELLAACSPAGRSLAEAVAVLGAGTAVRDAAALAGVADDLLPVLDEVSAAGLIRFAPHGLTEVGPASPMIRSAVLATLGPSRRAALHRQAADLVADPARALRLLVAASPTPDPAVADRLDALAGERAAEGAWAAAASLLTDASRLTEDLSLRESRISRAVDALIGAGEVLAATALVPEVNSLRRTPLRNAVLGYLSIVRGRAVEAETRLGRAWDLVNADRDPHVAAMICQRYVLHALARCRPEELVAWAERAISLSEPDAPAAVEAAAIRGLGLAVMGQADRARDDYTDLALRVGHGAQVQRVVMARGWLNLMTDAVDDARADLELAVPTTVLGGSSRISLWARAWLARVQFLTGEWDEAERTVRDSWELVERSGIVLTGPLTGWTEVALHALRGDWDQAEQALVRCDTGARDYEIMRIPLHLARAHIAEARADSDGVLRALQALTRSSAADDPGLWPWPDMYAHALVLTGRHDEADEFLGRHEQIAAARGHISARARLSAARGRLLAAQGDLPAAWASFEEALRLLDELPLRYDQARVNFAYGQTLRRAGKRREADAVIVMARAGFAAMGGTTYVARCDRELKAGGVNTARPERVFNELTPQEEAVSQLVASGLSNRDVAAELFLSAKTVQYHLTRVYAKLGIHSRSELAARLNPR